MRLLTLVLLLVTSLGFAEDPLIHRPTGRRMPSLTDSECVYLESVWGSVCKVTCDMTYVPMFFSPNRVIEFRLMTSENVAGPTDSSFDFSDVDSTKVAPEWDTSIKWVEWYTKEPGEEYKVIPLQGCYCDEIHGVIHICRNGQLVETTPQ